MIDQETGDGYLRVVLDHSPVEGEKPAARFTIEVWSHNSPVLLMRHTTENVGQHDIEDMKTYLFMDYDVGGPKSYKDDIGVFDEKSDIISVSDDNPLCVAMTSKPKPDGHEIASPVKLGIDVKSRDLKNNLELGPRDIAIGLQWNHGDIKPGESKSIDVVVASAEALDKVRELIVQSWDLFDEKMR